MVSTMGRKKSKFDTRPKTTTSARTPQEDEYYTDEDGKVHVREHEREGRPVKKHSRRKKLLSRMKSEPEKPESQEEKKDRWKKKSHSKQYLEEFDKKADGIADNLEEKAEGNY